MIFFQFWLIYNNNIGKTNETRMHLLCNGIDLQTKPLFVTYTDAHTKSHVMPIVYAPSTFIRFLFISTKNKIIANVLQMHK